MYDEKQIAKARELSKGRVGARERNIWDGDDFHTVWTATLGGQFVGMGDGKHLTRDDALNDAREYKAHCLRVAAST